MDWIQQNKTRSVCHLGPFVFTVNLLKEPIPGTNRFKVTKGVSWPQSPHPDSCTYKWAVKIECVRRSPELVTDGGAFSEAEAKLAAENWLGTHFLTLVEAGVNSNTAPSTAAVLASHTS